MSIPLPVRSERKPRGQGAERREEILEAALHLFAQHGVHGVSTRMIAEAVGISQPTLYAYFATKDLMLEEVSSRAFAELYRRMEAIGPELDTSERLCALGRAYIRFGLEQPDAYRIAFMIERDLSPEDVMQAHAQAKPGQNAFDLPRQAVEAHLGAGHPDIEVVAQSIWASAHGLVSLLIARCWFPWVDRELLIERHVEMMRRSLPPRAG